MKEPKFIKDFKENQVENTEVLSKEERAELVSKLTGKEAVKVEGYDTPFLLRDGGEVVWLTAVVDGEQSKPGAMIRKKDGVIVKYADSTTPEEVDKILMMLSQN